uniref:Flavin-containing monooxygenase n=1 Tax=Panagrolaimus sp. JU765 TaxID=591449 RepID=A0AC34RPP9_9BILA
MAKKKVAIIGAGASGLAAIRHALLYGFEPVCFEATNDIGGLWRYKEDERSINGTPLASVMKSTVINSSKEMTAYSDFPPPSSWPNFMHNRQMMVYFRKYAEAYQLTKYIRFNHFIKNVERTFDFENTGNWNVFYVDETHPTLNDELPTRLASGTIIMKPAIRKFTANGICFVDGSIVEQVDTVICATGYSISFPMLEDGKLIPVNDNKVELYKYMYPPELSDKNTLAIIGLTQPLGSFLPISEMQARVFFDVFAGNSKLPKKEEMLEDIRAKQEALKNRYLPTRRHTIQVDYIPFMDELAKLIGCYPSIWKIASMDPFLAWKVFSSPTPSYVYRILGPHSWEGAKEALLEAESRVKDGCNPGKPKTWKPKEKSFGFFKFFIIGFVICIILKLFF